MAIDMKEVISEGCRRLMLEKKVKKLTVKEIAEECNISRQAFYYHFNGGIPDLMKWKIEKEFDKMLQECLEADDLETGMGYIFSIILNAHPEVKSGIQSSYRDDLEKMLKDYARDFFRRVIEAKGLYRNYSPPQREIIARYHSNALIGIASDWSKKDAENMEETTHLLFLLMMGEVH